MVAMSPNKILIRTRPPCPMFDHPYKEESNSGYAKKDSGAALDGLYCYGIKVNSEEVEYTCNKKFVEKFTAARKNEFRPMISTPAYWCPNCGRCLCHPCFGAWVNKKLAAAGGSGIAAMLGSTGTRQRRSGAKAQEPPKPQEPSEPYDEALHAMGMEAV